MTWPGTPRPTTACKRSNPRLGVEVTHVEGIDPADAERVIRDFASQGYDLIVAHSYDYGDAVARIAKDFPDVYFLHGTAEGHGANFANYDVPSHEGGYLVGMLAGVLTKSNVIGIVNSFDIPSMVMVSEAFKLGVKETNPDAKVMETFVGAWNDAAKGGEAANAQIDSKADFIMAMGDHTGLGAIQAAQKRGAVGCRPLRRPERSGPRYGGDLDRESLRGHPQAGDRRYRGRYVRR